MDVCGCGTSWILWGSMLTEPSLALKEASNIKNKNKSLDKAHGVEEFPVAHH